MVMSWKMIKFSLLLVKRLRLQGSTFCGRSRPYLRMRAMAARGRAARRLIQLLDALISFRVRKVGSLEDVRPLLNEER